MWSAAYGKSCFGDPSLCEEFTVMFWIKVTSYDKQVIFTAGDSCSDVSHGDGLCFYTAGGSFWLNEGLGTTLLKYRVSAGWQLYGKWTHFMLKYNKSPKSYEFYINRTYTIFSKSEVPRKLDHVRRFEDERFGRDVHSFYTGTLILDEFHHFGKKLKSSEAQEIIGKCNQNEYNELLGF